MIGTSVAIQAASLTSAYRPHRVAGRKAEYGRFSVLPRPEIYRNLRIKDSVKIHFACGTGGFLADSISHLQKQAKSVEDIHKIKKSVYGIEWKQLPYMLCVTNMYLHNIDDPHIVHGDGLAKDDKDCPCYQRIVSRYPTVNKRRDHEVK